MAGINDNIYKANDEYCADTIYNFRNLGFYQELGIINQTGEKIYVCNIYKQVYEVQTNIVGMSNYKSLRIMLRTESNARARYFNNYGIESPIDNKGFKLKAFEINVRYLNEVGHIYIAELGLCIAYTKHEALAHHQAMPEFFEEEYKEEISVLEITGRNINELSHRDFLGSLMGLGVERKTVGDILVYEDRAYVFILKDMEDYILENVDKIGRHGVKIRSIMPDELTLPEKKTEEISGTVSAPRLDAVVALCTRLSRGKASELIETDKVSVNWEVKNNVSLSLKDGDLISIRGYGRFKLDKINGLSRKGRIHITILKYI